MLLIWVSSCCHLSGTPKPAQYYTDIEGHSILEDVPAVHQLIISIKMPSSGSVCHAVEMSGLSAGSEGRIPELFEEDEDGRNRP